MNDVEIAGLLQGLLQCLLVSHRQKVNNVSPSWSLAINSMSVKKLAELNEATSAAAIFEVGSLAPALDARHGCSRSFGSSRVWAPFGARMVKRSASIARTEGTEAFGEASLYTTICVCIYIYIYIHIYIYIYPYVCNIPRSICIVAPNDIGVW